jgi:hypothetical protein
VPTIYPDAPLNGGHATGRVRPVTLPTLRIGT